MRYRHKNLMSAFIFVFLFGCASVPKEVVELSYNLGKDLNSVHSSYRVLVKEYFQNLRGQATEFLENKWIPTYLKDFIKEGELAKKASATDAAAVLEDVQIWVEVAMETIESKKRELLEPIDKDENDLLSYVDDSFSRLYLANSTITSHLNSLRKVQEIQEEALKALNLNDLKDKVNEKLIRTSENAKKAIEKLKKAQETVNQIEEKKQQLQKKEKNDE